MQTSPLKLFWVSQSAALWQEEGGFSIPASFGSTAMEYASLCRNAAVTDQSHRGKIKVTGSERVSFLNRMLTNDLNAVQEGSGQRSFLLSAQGKCLADFRIFRGSDFLILDTEPNLAAEAIQQLNRYIIADDVFLTDITAEWLHLSIDGPKSFELQIPLNQNGAERFIFNLPATASLSGWPALHLYAPNAQATAIAEDIGKLALKPCGHMAFNQVRLDCKVPRYKVEFDETWFLNETGLEETAASETKGCYPGQEVVARIKTYKKVERKIFL